MRKAKKRPSPTRRAGVPPAFVRRKRGKPGRDISRIPEAFRPRRKYTAAARRQRAMEEIELAQRHGAEGQEYKRLSDTLEKELKAFPKGFVNSIKPETWREIKVMLWNGEFSAEEAIRFMKLLNANIRRPGWLPKDAVPNTFLRETVAEIVRRRQRELEESGSIQTTFA